MLLGVWAWTLCGACWWWLSLILRPLDGVQVPVSEAAPAPARHRLSVPTAPPTRTSSVPAAVQLRDT